MASDTDADEIGAQFRSLSLGSTQRLTPGSTIADPCDCTQLLTPESVAEAFTQVLTCASGGATPRTNDLVGLTPPVSLRTPLRLISSSAQTQGARAEPKLRAANLFAECTPALSALTPDTCEPLHARARVVAGTMPGTVDTAVPLEAPSASSTRTLTPRECPEQGSAGGRRPRIRAVDALTPLDAARAAHTSPREGTWTSPSIEQSHAGVECRLSDGTESYSESHPDAGRAGRLGSASLGGGEIEDEIEEWEDEAEDCALEDGAASRRPTAEAMRALGASLSPPARDCLRWMARHERTAHGRPGAGGVLCEHDTLASALLVRCALHLAAAAAEPGVALEARTLIVVPPARVAFWEAELRRVAPAGRVVLHHGRQRCHSVGPLLHAQCVLSTYTLLAAADFGGGLDPDDDDAEEEAALFALGVPVWRRKASAASAACARAERKGATRSMLHMGRWGRVIFDEAHQQLKGGSSRRSAAARALRAAHRWAIVGAESRTHAESEALHAILRNGGVRLDGAECARARASAPRELINPPADEPGYDSLSD